MNSFHLSAHKWQEPFLLEGPEAHHLATVLRIRPGAHVRLFDGAGRFGVFAVVEVFRNKAHLSPITIEISPIPKRRICLALGWNKTARRGWLLEKVVELEAAELVFWQAERSQGRVPDMPKESWQRQLLTAAKQCGNPWLPALRMVNGSAVDLANFAASFASKVLLWENASRESMFDPACLAPAGPSIIVLGPEGGLTREEAEVFIQAGFAALSLGKMTLRWETAALLSLGLCYWRHQKDEPFHYVPAALEQSVEST